MQLNEIFQSTLLIRRATAFALNVRSGPDFNPRSSYEERPPQHLAFTQRIDFNPRSSYEERLAPLSATICSPISIHAPHTKSDLLYTMCWMASVFQSTLLIRRATSTCRLGASVYNFNPRSSYEERLDDGDQEAKIQISIHAPHTKSDLPLLRASGGLHFNPRSSYEERRYLYML